MVYINDAGIFGKHEFQLPGTHPNGVQLGASKELAETKVDFCVSVSRCWCLPRPGSHVAMRSLCGLQVAPCSPFEVRAFPSPPFRA